MTYRYYLQTQNTSSSTGLFQDGTVTLTFKAGAFATTNGTSDVAFNMGGLTQTFTISDAAAGGATSRRRLSLGPAQPPGADDQRRELRLQGRPARHDDHGRRQPGRPELRQRLEQLHEQPEQSGVSVNLTGIVGTLEVEVDALGLLSGKFRVNVPGNFSLHVASLSVQVPNVVNSVAHRGSRSRTTPRVPSNQQLVVIDSAAISFPELNVSGTILPYNPATGQNVAAGSTATGLIPGLTIYENGFTIGEAELIYGVGGQSSTL